LAYRSTSSTSSSASSPRPSSSARTLRRRNVVILVDEDDAESDDEAQGGEQGSDDDDDGGTDDDSDDGDYVQGSRKGRRRGATRDAKARPAKRARHGTMGPRPAQDPAGRGEEDEASEKETHRDRGQDGDAHPVVRWRRCGDGHDAECSICMRDDGRLLWHAAAARPCTLRDLRDERYATRDGARLPDDVVLANPCRRPDHMVCVACARVMLLNPGRPPVGYDRAVVGCLSLEGETRCSGASAASYDDPRCFALVLDPVEVERLVRLYDRHRFPGMEIVACPLEVAVGRPTPDRPARLATVPCGAECIVERTRVTAAARGRLIVACTQNPRCAGAFCYHCRRRVGVGAAQCPRCTQARERDNPDGVNRYFCRPDLLRAPTASASHPAEMPPWMGQALTPDAHLVRNRDLTDEAVIEQVERVLGADRVAQPCYRCGVPLLKSTQCNALSHCGVEKCYMCGRNSLAGGHLEAGHWDPEGRQGCPRYDHHAYWRQRMQPAFVCIEGQCYSDAVECVVASHQPGIAAMHGERRAWHVWGMLASLPVPMCARALARLEAATSPADARRRALLARVRRSVLPGGEEGAGQGEKATDGGSVAARSTASASFSPSSSSSSSLSSSSSSSSSSTARSTVATAVATTTGTGTAARTTTGTGTAGTPERTGASARRTARRTATTQTVPARRR
jgi:hypothetical protein